MDTLYWDAFLCHNGRDEQAVLALCRDLEGRGLRCWLDRHTLKPGTEWTEFVESEALRIRSMVVTFGPHGISEGQQFEIDNLIPIMVDRDAPVIPVVLETCPEGPAALAPPFTPNTIYSDLRKDRPDEIDKLVWAINGRNPFEREAVGAYYDGLEDAMQGDLKPWLSARLARGHTPIPYRRTTDLVADLFTSPHAPSRLITYDGQSVEKSPEDTPRYKVWNKDHIWPKAFGYGHHPTVHGDLHNIVPALPQKNAQRGAGLFYDAFLDRDTPLKEALVPSGPWDPRGMIARACMYMAVRYTGQDDEPALHIVEGDPAGQGPSCIGSLRTLLYWHKIAPVTTEERRRVDRIVQLQGNRNPFVDHPELADQVFYPV